MDDIKENLDELKRDILTKVREYFKISQRNGSIAPKPYVKYVWRVWDENELEALVGSALDQKITYGEIGKRFEREFAEFLDNKYSLFVNSGSSANLIAVSALRSPVLEGNSKYPLLKDEDEAITPAATFPTTLNALLVNKIKPVFVDVDLGTYNMNPQNIENSLSDKTRLIMLPHTLGNPNEMDSVMSLAEKHNLWVIEDSCDALGSEYKGQKLGAIGDMGTFSFYLSHHMSTGEGGAVTTSNSRLKRVLESLRDWGRDCWCEPYKSNTCGKRFGWQLGDLPFGYDHKYTYSNIGFNLKPLDLQAAIGLEQIKKLPQIISRRKENFNKIYEGLKEFEEYLILPQSIEGADPCWFSFPLTVRRNNGFNRADLITYLDEKSIETRPFFAGNITKQPAYKNLDYRVSGNLKNTDKIMADTFFIGSHPMLTEDMIGHVLTSFKQYFDKI